MKRKFLIFSLAIVATSVSTLTLSFLNNGSETGTSLLSFSEIEALAVIEQPNVDDCVTHLDFDCEALHPLILQRINSEKVQSGNRF